MKIILIFVFSLFLYSCTNSTGILEKDTGFGGKYYFLNDDNTNILHITLIFDNVGAHLDPKGMAGLADLTVDLMSSGNAKYSKKQFQNLLDILGIDYGVELSRDFTKFKFSCLKKDIDNLFNVMNLILKNANFKQKDLDSEITNRIGNINTALSNDDFLAEYYTKTRFFKNDLSYPQDGTVNSLKNIKRNDLLYFYKNYFVKENLSISVLGKINDNLLNKTYNFVSKLNSGVQVKQQKDFAYKKGKNIFFVNKPKTKENNVYMILSINDINFSSYKVTWLDLFTNIFSSGMDSVLFTNVRKKHGVSYHIGGSWANEGKSPLYYTISFNPRLGMTGLGLKLVLESMQNTLNKGVNEEAFKIKKSYLNNFFVYKLATKTSVLERYLTHDILGFNKEYDNTYINRLNAIKFKDFNSFIKTIFKKDIFIGIVGDKRELKQDKILQELMNNFNISYINYTKILTD